MSAVGGHGQIRAYYVAENLSSRATEFEARLVTMTGVSAKAAAEEVAVSIRRIFWYEAQADGTRDVLAEHDDVAALWYFGSKAGSALVEKASAGNLKPAWANHSIPRRWNESSAQGREFLRRATQVKNIWVPCGE